ncbi:hypothetical protein EYF80_048156 [Liparis tanakae]|uniref:Uncharacterized protein n=1 Tax=Liparis tanakae TaxID=230148 RepID=A0A4Z2FLM7_9TELE|nr:hypothetical protein EYF80_048156 [Liparis tanakae]
MFLCIREKSGVLNDKQVHARARERAHRLSDGRCSAPAHNAVLTNGVVTEAEHPRSGSPHVSPVEAVSTVNCPPPRRANSYVPMTLTELMKQPGDAGLVDASGVHHPIGTNGISARSLRSNNGQCSMCVSVHMQGFASGLGIV